jgi:hypothetical protein
MSSICNELRRGFQQKLFVCPSIIPTILVSEHVDQLGVVSMAEAGINATISMTNPTLPLFKGENYEFWSIKMRMMLKSHGLWGLVEVGAPNPDPTPIDTTKRDVKALFFIQQAIHDKVFVKIATTKTTKEA